jgi:hypothetical protein
MSGKSTHYRWEIIGAQVSIQETAIQKPWCHHRSGSSKTFVACVINPVCSQQTERCNEKSLPSESPVSTSTSSGESLPYAILYRPDSMQSFLYTSPLASVKTNTFCMAVLKQSSYLKSAFRGEAIHVLFFRTSSEVIPISRSWNRQPTSLL